MITRRLDRAIEKFYQTGKIALFLTMMSVSLCMAQDKNLAVTVDGVSFTMVRVDGGTFMMGATAEQGNSVDKDEHPMHQVTVSSYYIGETEVTQKLWEAVMGSNPSRSKSPQNPVEEVSWVDCQEFILKLNKLTGREFRLPTEAEWEFAARGGNSSRGYKYSGRNTALCEKSPDGSPNELGIYGMSSNVWEWCADWFGKYSSEPSTDPTGPGGGKFRVNRGGSYNGNAVGCRVSDRGYNRPSDSMCTIGLRLAL